MSRRGRQPWSNRLLVEDCFCLDITILVRSGVLRAKLGTLYSTAWSNTSEQEILKARFFVELTANGKTLLHISYGVPSSLPLMHYGQSESVEIVQTKLTFGPRPWFLCPGTYNKAPCRRRVRILYFLPNTYRLGCRKCLNLIHRSAREHDKRIDALLKLPISEFRDT